MDVISDPLNLSDEKLLDWVNQTHKKGDSLDLVIEPSIFDARGLTREAKIDLPGSLGEVHTITAIRRQYRVERFGQPVSDCFVIIPLRTTLLANAKAVLGVQRNLGDEALKAIIEAFTSYSPATHGAAATYISSRLTEYNQNHNPVFRGDEFNLLLDVSYEWKSVQKDLKEDDWLHRVFEIDASDSLPDIYPQEGQDLGQDGYRLTFINDEYLKIIPPIQKSKNEIPVKNGKISDEAFIDEIVKKRAGELSEAGNRDCDFLETHKIRITSIKAPDETKWEWAWVYLDTGRGCGFHMYMYSMYTRSCSKVLYATVRWARPEDALKKIFIDSAQEAAKLATAVAIIAGSFETGLAIFKAEFWRLIKEHALQTYNCLIPDLIFPSETGEWKLAQWPDPVEPEPEA
ncbi:hypothetical protein [Pseudomonas sp. IT-P258]|uniref:hypothetical protein n=1 Tax=Pseudomonas sp. IT-P258 TaxID=3026447 RepID=UPI0039DFDDDD